MIMLAGDYLLLELPSGESMPCSPDLLSRELLGGMTELFDSEFVEHATNAVCHYFKHELGRQSVTVGEFRGALEKVLQGFAATAQSAAPPAPPPLVVEYDLGRLALESAAGCELFFFPRLRADMQQHLRQGPRVLRVRGLRDCVKQLAGAERWSRRCEALEGEIVTYLRQCLSAEPAPADITLVLE